jgi:hypothetical protein
MSGGIIDRYADSLVENSKLVILLLLAATALVAAGPVVDDTEGGDIGQFATGSAAEAAQEEIGATYGEDEGAVTQIVVRDERGDVLTRESLLDGLYLQQEIREEDAIDATLQEDDAIGGVENVVATAAYFQQQAQSGGPVEGEPTLAEQIDALEALDEEGFDALLDDVFDPATETPGPDATAFLPSSYEPGTTTADARLTFVFHASADSVEGGEDAVGDAQLASSTSGSTTRSPSAAESPTTPRRGRSGTVSPSSRPSHWSSSSRCSPSPTAISSTSSSGCSASPS